MYVTEANHCGAHEGFHDWREVVTGRYLVSMCLFVTHATSSPRLSRAFGNASQ